MRAVCDGEADAETWCRGEGLGDFRALLQVSDRVAPPNGSWASAHCA